MREILFRAKREATNEWVYGYFVNEYDDFRIYVQPQIITRSGREYVNENTLGQFTGLTDKNGVKIFEGDIVEYETGKKVRIGRVFFSDFRASFSVTAGKNGSARINNDLFNYIQNRNSVIVIGNIYDNPELIGGADNENS